MDGKYRFLNAKAGDLLKSFPAVVILGARQCGKSTLAKMLRPTWTYYDLENPNHLDRISDDPVLFFREHPQKLILDEAQQYPRIFDILRSVIDSQRNVKNRFIITGSASFDLQKNISESLAGRVALLELSPFKMDECLENSLSPFFKVFEEKITKDSLRFLKQMKPSKNIQQIKQYLLRGGYPEPVLQKNHTFYLNWMENYIKTYISRDMRSLYPRIDLIKYKRVVSMISSLSGTIINRSEIARSIETSEKSVRDYLDIISGTYFWRSLPAFKTSKIKTTIKMPKGHFRDSGLSFFLQNVYTAKDLDNYPKLGNIFEAFVIEEILRGLEVSKCHNLQCSHFRTKAGGEIDLIVEGSFGLVPIEIKMQSNTSKKQIPSMIHFIDIHNLPLGIIVNYCEKPSLITEKIIQIPVGCL